MSDRSFEITIEQRFCKGCGLCVETCEQGKLCLREKPDRRGIRIAAVRTQADCTGCLQCATICPDAAIEISQTNEPVGSAPGDRSDR